MINLYNANIENLYIHQVGNKCRGEGVFFSQEPYEISDEIRPLLKEFFLKPFREKEEQYFKFSEDMPIAHLFVPYNTELHKDIAEHLYNQGTHPHIKSGEVYICQLSNIIIDNEKVHGFGIFKSELKSDFLQFEKGTSRLEMNLQQGVNLDKLDKGALILTDPESKTGFRILYIDSNKYDSKYWMENFLNLEELEDDHYKTKKYLKFCEAFANKVILPAEDKQTQMEFINDTYAHFASRDEFIEEEYLGEVFTEASWIDHPESFIQEFENFKMLEGPKYSVQDFSDFSISNEMVNECMKKVKGEINLDTGISIKVVKGSKAASTYLEKGWDEDKQMYYYLAYFNKEEK